MTLSGTRELVDALTRIDPPTYTGPQVAERAPTSREIADRLWRALGFPDIPDDRPAFTDDDLRALRLATTGLSDLAPERQAEALDMIVQEARTLSSYLADLAEAELGFASHMLRLGIRAAVLAQAAERGLEHSDLGWLILYIFRRQLAAAATRRPDLDGSDAVQLAVGFVDLVGFTSLAAQATDDELTTLITSFQALAFDAIAESGGRAVKLIGDEVMYVADDPVEAIGVATRLRDDAQAAGLSDMRAGIALGRVIAYGGDYYGPVVNLASRLATVASPRQVLIDRNTRRAIENSPAVAFQTRRTLDLKGLGATEAWSAASRTPVCL